MAERRRAATGSDVAGLSQPTSVRENEPTSDVHSRPVLLIVDDLDDNREMYGTYFEAIGYRVLEAGDGEEALDIITRDPPDVVVMDLSMPRLDGWETTRLIKSNPRTEKIVVIVATAFSSRDDLARARAAGADDVCTKPCTPKELLAKIEVHLRRSAIER
jgi:CheY-like chemotaxis protein